MRSIVSFAHWKQDLPASVVVFLVAMPLCLGIALASGAPLISGLVAGAVGGIVVGAISGSALGVSGPAAGLVAIVLTAIADLGGYEAFLLAVVLAGVLQLVFGALRAGIIAYYFPNAVIKGMLAGIGITIVLKQIPHAVGYDADYMGDMTFEQPDHHTTWSELFYMVDAINLGAIIITLACLGVMLLWERPWVRSNTFLRLIPGPLLAVLLGAVLARLFSTMPALAIGADHFVAIPEVNGMNDLHLPAFDGILSWKVWKVAFTIAVVASIETLLCVEATDKLDPYNRTTPANRELVAQGAGNIVSGLLGGLPVTQVIVRSSANIQAGGRSSLSTIVHGMLIVVSAMLLPDLLRSIPFACLAAVLLLVGYKLVKPSQFRTMWNSGIMQFLPFLVTVVCVYAIDLLWGVGLGLFVSIMYILWKNYRVPYHFEQNKHRSGLPIHIRLSEDVTFLNKAGIKRTLLELPRGCQVVLDASRTIDLDPDVREIIDEFLASAPDREINVELIGYDTPPPKPVSVEALAGIVRKFAADTGGSRTRTRTQ
ncbi:MAG TPA: SulP family inorganic anion transporter [Flavobacteriales bacterium]|nr:SulP family inorganic anion transporter [Flavobacteriales bacterium]